MIYLDTHVLVWLAAGELQLFNRSILDRLNSERLMVSPMCLLELEYLYETKRIKQNADAIIGELKGKLELEICPQSFENIIMFSLRETWTRDPFDRIITAQARLENDVLVTKDRSIQKHFKKAIW